MTHIERERRRKRRGEERRVTEGRGKQEEPPMLSLPEAKDMPVIGLDCM